MHDELVMEVDPSVLREAGLLLKMCMGSAASLLGTLTICIIVILLSKDEYSFYVVWCFSPSTSKGEGWQDLGFIGAFHCQ